MWVSLEPRLWALGGRSWSFIHLRKHRDADESLPAAMGRVPTPPPTPSREDRKFWLI